MNQALEDQNFDDKTTTNDIRTWLYSGIISDRVKCRRLKTDEDTWYDSHKYDSDDSDVTANYGNKFPDEENCTWCPNTSSTIRFISTVVNNLIVPK